MMSGPRHDPSGVELVGARCSFISRLNGSTPFGVGRFERRRPRTSSGAIHIQSLCDWARRGLPSQFKFADDSSMDFIVIMKLLRRFVRFLKKSALLGCCVPTIVLHAAQPSLQSLVLPGRWNQWPAWQARWSNSLPGGPFQVTLSGHYAYVAHEVGLVVFDVSDPTNCVRVGGFPITPGLTRGVAISSNYAYVAAWNRGLQVLDVSNPTNCFRLGGYDISNGSWDLVAVAGHYAYVADYSPALHVIDVRDPTNCVRVGGCVIEDSPFGLAVSGHYVYVAARSAGLVVIDVSNPTNSVKVGGYPGWGNDVVISKNYAYVATSENGLQILDVSNPTNCVLVGNYGNHIHDVAVAGKYAYLTGDYGGMEVVDVSNPSNCVSLASFNTGPWPPIYRVAVNADRVFLAGYEQGLLVLPALPSAQFTVRVNATTHQTFTIETTTNLNVPTPWTPLLTTNVPVMPFDFVDVNLSDKSQKYYRVHQP